MQSVLHFLLGIVLSYVAAAAEREHNRSASPLINSSYLLDSLLEGYDKRLGPFIFAGEATVVKVGLFVVDMQTIEDQQMEYTISAHVRRKWRDPRLSYDVTDFPNISQLNIPSETLARLWVPDIYFLNERKGNAHELTTPNTALYIYPDGHVFVASKLTLRLACPMYMQKFPLDTQYCKVEMESYAHTMADIILVWMDSKLEIPSNLNLVQFTLLNRVAEECLNDYSIISQGYSCLRGVFVLKRKYNYHLISMFIPSGFIVVVSWVSFWISRDAVPGRITLSVTTVLTMITQGFIASFTLPQVPYVKAIDVWMTVCTTFVFAALLEYALVNVVQRKHVQKSKVLQQKDITSSRDNTRRNGLGSEVDTVLSLASLLATLGGDASDTALKIDKVSRLVFPVAFALFLIGFWSFYLVWEPERPDLQMGRYV